MNEDLTELTELNHRLTLALVDKRKEIERLKKENAELNDKIGALMSNCEDAIADKKIAEEGLSVAYLFGRSKHDDEVARLKAELAKSRRMTMPDKYSELLKKARMEGVMKEYAPVTDLLEDAREEIMRLKAELQREIEGAADYHSTLSEMITVLGNDVSTLKAELAKYTRIEVPGRMKNTSPTPSTNVPEGGTDA